MRKKEKIQNDYRRNIKMNLKSKKMERGSRMARVREK